MRDRLKAPIWLLLAAAGYVVSGVVLLAADFAWLGAFALGLNLVLAWLLVRGSRAGWVFIVLTQASGLVLDGLGVWWKAVLVLLLFVCLLMPSSLAYVWKRQAVVVPGAWWLRLRGILREKVSWASALLAFLLLMVVGGAFGALERGAGEGSTLVSVAGDVFRGMEVIALFVFIVLAVTAAGRALTQRWRSAPSAPDPGETGS
jgi:hypothetical protein